MLSAPKLLLLLLIAWGAAAVDLYPFGPSQSDQKLPESDEETGIVTLPTPFIFFGQSYSIFNVSLQQCV